MSYLRKPILVQTSMSSQVRLNFNHPYSQYLMLFNVPREKWDDFFELFGEYYYTNTTPKEEHTQAIRWMMSNAVPSGKQKEMDPSDGYDINPSETE